MTDSGFLRFVKNIRSNIPFQNTIYGAVRAVGVPESLYRHMPINGWITIASRHGRRFRMFSYGDVVENSLFWSSDRRGEDTTSFQAWERLAAIADGMILDIGANTGLYALLAKAANPDATVKAFEPVKRIANKLTRNIVGNGYDIEVIEKAVSDRNGVATFHDSADPDSSTNGYSASLENSFGFNDRSYQVDVVTLDSMLADAKVSLIKLDVELHEVSALRGMMAIIDRDRSSILIEVINEEIAEEVTRMLKPFGYEFYPIEEKKGLHAASRLRPLPGHNFNNIACLPHLVRDADLSQLMARG